MTDRERDLFISVAQMGWACGLEHPYEWLEQALSHYDMFPPGQIDEIESAFVSFFKGCAGYPTDPIENMTKERLRELVRNYYKRTPNYEN